MLYFAYGSNMSRHLMGLRCPGAVSCGPATREGYEFFINTSGHGSIRPAPGRRVHGVVWRLAARHVAALNNYEGIDTGLYRRLMASVRTGDGMRSALVYVTNDTGKGRPHSAYMPLVIAAARDWAFPDAYISELSRIAPMRWRGARRADTGELK
jgi:gamma-glutamylcyclotransferase (GGCT)/AIG2-like uncharacterized protein YtfP